MLGALSCGPISGGPVSGWFPVVVPPEPPEPEVEVEIDAGDAGWDAKRAAKKLKAERDLENYIRRLVRGEPEILPAVEEIIAPAVAGASGPVLERVRWSEVSENMELSLRMLKANFEFLRDEVDENALVAVMFALL
jgi:hypothetical protein